MNLRELLSKIKGGYSLVSPIIVNVCDEGSLMDSTIEDTATSTENRTWTDEYTQEYSDRKVVLVGANSVGQDLDKPVTIGRSRKCDIRVESESVSKRHASITLNREEGAYFLIDTESRNGTFINGQKIVPNQKTDLWSGAYVSFGDAVFVFLDAPTLRKLSRMSSAQL